MTVPYTERTAKPPQAGVALPAGLRLGHYRLLRKLGGGGFGITYLAEELHSRREVVIKECLPGQFATRAADGLHIAVLNEAGFRWALNGFWNEASLIAEFRHPNIVRVENYFEALGTYYYVMPSVGGRSLRDVLATAEFSIEQRIALAERVQTAMLSALETLHARNVLHRDIKPDNILLTADDTPVLIDFGAAREQMAEKTMTIMATPGFAPVEQMQQHDKKGPWTDIYALGATLYNILTGEVPVDAAYRFGKEVHVDPLVPLSHRIELQIHGNSRFLRCVDRAMRVWPEDRWQSVAEWRRGLQSAVAEKPVEPGSRYWRHAFRVKGRLGLGRYWGGTAVLMLLWGGAAAALYAAGLNREECFLQWQHHLPLLAVAAAVSLVFLVLHICATVRRLHDANFYATGAAFLFIPVLGWLYLAFLCLHPGIRGQNDFGPDPDADETPFFPNI